MCLYILYVSASLSQEYQFDEILKRIIKETLNLVLSSDITSALSSYACNQMPQLADANITNQVPLTPINHNWTNQLGAANVINQTPQVSTYQPADYYQCSRYCKQ